MYLLGLKKKDSVSEHLKGLHWLKVQERIEYKILLLVYKSLNGMAPEYLGDLIKYNNVSGSRTPSLQCFVPKTSKGNKAFQSCSPRLWNMLPFDIRQSDDLNLFKKKLKSHLFTKSFQ